MLRILLFYLFLKIGLVLSDWLHSKLSGAILRVVPDTSESGDRGFNRTVTVVANDHAMINCLQLVYVTALNNLLQTVAQLRFIIYPPPPGDAYIICVWVLRSRDERYHEFKDERLAVFEMRIV